MIMRRALQFILPIAFVSLASAASPDSAGFAKNMKALLQDLCVDCHGGGKPKGETSLEGINGDLVAGQDVSRWIKVLDQLTLGEMPPAQETQPSSAERRAMIAWIRRELGKGGRFPENKLERPGNGNYVKHEQLFGKEDFGPSFSPPRVWRIRPQVYEEGIRAVAKNGKYVRPFTMATGGHGFRDYDGQYKLAGADLNQLMANARTASAQLTVVEKDGKKGRSTPDVFYALVKDDTGMPSDDEIGKAIDWLFARVMLRDSTDEERTRLLAFGRQSMKADGSVLGTKNLISAILLNPDSLYRSERGDGVPDEYGRTRLSPRELAYAISFALTDSRPDSMLLKAAESGKLSTSEDIAVQVQRILEGEKIAKPRILQFFREYFEYGDAVDVFKDEELFIYHDPKVLVSDTDRLVMQLFDEDKDVLKQLLTTQKSFVQYTVDKDKPKKANSKRSGVHLSYNLPMDWKWISDQPITLPGKQRAGILTQPAWLVAKSGNFENHAILRGLWIRKKLLGGTIPDLPITVDAQLPEDPHKTLRQRMEVTEEKYCWKCHSRMNPLGLSFEMFDHFGRWRTRELAKPVITAGVVTNTGDKKLDGDVPNAITLLHRLAESERVRQVFVRHAFRYWMGRNETLHDAATLRSADKAYIDSGGSMKALITAILTSDSFLYRKEIDA